MDITWTPKQMGSPFGTCWSVLGVPWSKASISSDQIQVTPFNWDSGLFCFVLQKRHLINKPGWLFLFSVIRCWRQDSGHVWIYCPTALKVYNRGIPARPHEKACFHRDSPMAANKWILWKVSCGGFDSLLSESSLKYRRGVLNTDGALDFVKM